jgi:hypothetical protein
MRVLFCYWFTGNGFSAHLALRWLDSFWPWSFSSVLIGVVRLVWRSSVLLGFGRDGSSSFQIHEKAETNRFTRTSALPLDFARTG